MFRNFVKKSSTIMKRTIFMPKRFPLLWDLMGWKNLPGRHFSHCCHRSQSVPPWFSGHILDICVRLHGVHTPLYFYISLTWFVALLEEFTTVFSSLHSVWKHFMVTRSLSAILNMLTINLDFCILCNVILFSHRYGAFHFA